MKIASWDSVTSQYLVYNHYSNVATIYTYASLTDFREEGYRIISFYAIGNKII